MTNRGVTGVAPVERILRESGSDDAIILALIEGGRLRVDAVNGLVYAPRSNTPNKPLGTPTKKGYLRTCICIDGKRRRHYFMVHRIVWVSVNGPPPAGYEIDHKNRSKSDNRISELEAVSGEENRRRATIDGAYRWTAERIQEKRSRGAAAPQDGRGASDPKDV